MNANPISLEAAALAALAEQPRVEHFAGMLATLKRELAMRKAVFPSRIASGKMSAAVAVEEVQNVARLIVKMEQLCALNGVPFVPMVSPKSASAEPMAPAVKGAAGGESRRADSLRQGAFL